MHQATFRPSIFFLIASFCFVGCPKPQPVAEPTPSPAQQAQATRAAEKPNSTQAQWTMLNRIRQDESLFISRTLLDQQDQLSLVFDSSVTPDKVPDLMHRVMTEMAQAFPKEDIAVAAYGPGTPLRALGSAHLDGKTGAITFVAPEK